MRNIVPLLPVLPGALVLLDNVTVVLRFDLSMVPAVVPPISTPPLPLAVGPPLPIHLAAVHRQTQK